jgi:hypothetical protein
MQIGDRVIAAYTQNEVMSGYYGPIQLFRDESYPDGSLLTDMEGLQLANGEGQMISVLATGGIWVASEKVEGWPTAPNPHGVITQVSNGEVYRVLYDDGFDLWTPASKLSGE